MVVSDTHTEAALSSKQDGLVLSTSPEMEIFESVSAMFWTFY